MIFTGCIFTYFVKKRGPFDQFCLKSPYHPKLLAIKTPIWGLNEKNPSLHTLFCLLRTEKDPMTSPILSLNIQNGRRLSLMFCFVLCTPQGMPSLLKCITLKIIGFLWSFILPYYNIAFVLKISLLANLHIWILSAVFQPRHWWNLKSFLTWGLFS